MEDTPLPLDGMDVWNAISEGEPSPRNEILLNIDLPPKEESPNAPSALTIYEGIALRSGDMKLLLSVENSSWFKPPELGEKPNKMQTKVKAAEHELLNSYFPL